MKRHSCDGPWRSLRYLRSKNSASGRRRRRRSRSFTCRRPSRRSPRRPSERLPSLLDVTFRLDRSRLEVCSSRWESSGSSSRYRWPIGLATRHGSALAHAAALRGRAPGEAPEDGAAGARGGRRGCPDGPAVGRNAEEKVEKI